MPEKQKRVRINKKVAAKWRGFFEQKPSLMGRPKKFKNKKELLEQLITYCAHCETDGRPMTMSGLALWCDVDRKTLLNYGNEEEYAEVVVTARNMIEAYAEEMLFLGKNVAGVIFSLKNNFSWTDKQEVSVEGLGGLTQLYDALMAQKTSDEKPKKDQPAA